MLAPGIDAIREMTGQSFACRAVGLRNLEIPLTSRVAFSGKLSMTLSVIMMPSEFVAMARGIGEMAKRP